MSLSGADDDGSGSVTILESYRALISSNFRPVRPVEFHWYSAEVFTLATYRKAALTRPIRRAAFSDLRLLRKPTSPAQPTCMQ